MDIKDLNKSQLILLAILLSFVVSIATGITTVTLMEQAPTSVTVPINRIVRETVEKIVPVEGKPTVQTVVVKEEDLVVDAIAKNQSALFSITNEDSGESLGKGFAVSAEGIIAADAIFIQDKDEIVVKNDSGSFRAELISSQSGVAFLKIGEAINGTDKISYAVPAFGDISTMKIGQKIIVYGENKITSLIFEGNKDLKIGIDRANAGGMVMDLDGDVLGIALFNEVTPFIPANTITEAIKTADAN